MKRLSDEKFFEMKPDMDKVVAIRVKNGDFYFIGWMEVAENYSIQVADDINQCKLDRTELIVNGDVYEEITHCNGYEICGLPGKRIVQETLLTQMIGNMVMPIRDFCHL